MQIRVAGPDNGLRWEAFFARIVCACMVLLARPAFAADAPPPGPASPNTVSILVGFGPAQGNDQPARPEAAAVASTRMSPDMSYDQTARFLARHLGRFLPGSPTIVARHIPGGAGLTAARMLFNARPDGHTIALLSSNIIFASALRLNGAEAPSDRFVWLGGVAPDAWACVRTRASNGKTTPWAGTLGIGSRSDVHARAMVQFFDYPLRIASGYVSRFELLRALENGEVDMACGWPLSDLEKRRAAWFDNDKMEIVQLFNRSASGAPPGEETIAKAKRLLFSETELAWPMAAPPGTPVIVADAYSAALQALAHDANALAEAQRAGITINPVKAEDVSAHVQALATMSDEERKVLLKLFAGPVR